MTNIGINFPCVILTLVKTLFIGHQEHAKINMARSCQKCKNSLGQALKDADRVAIYGDALANFHKVWGNNELVYHIDNIRKMY